jgi:hypothetical protein
MSPRLTGIPLLLFLLCSSSRAAPPASNRLQLALATCQTDSVEKILEAGGDANAKDSQGQSILRWLATNSRCNDSSALATAKALDEHGARFQDLAGNSGTSVLTNLAPRHLPKTLEFLSHKPGSGDATQALHAIARSADLESIRVLLAAGADPLAGAALGSSLFDASAAGQTPAVKEMLLHVKEKQSPKVLAAYEIAKKNSFDSVTQAFRDAGINPPEPVVVKPLCPHQQLTSRQRLLLRKAGVTVQAACKFVEQSGDLVLIDCNSAADGPAYYVDQSSTRVVATCGGACMRGCTGCPPPGWVGRCSY